MEPPKIPPLLQLTSLCSTCSRTWWVSSFLEWPSSRSLCLCPPVVHCPLLNSSRALLSAAWRTSDIATTPSQIWGVLTLVGSAWTQVLPQAPPPPCQLFSVHNAPHRILPLEELPTTPSHHLLTTPTCCLPHWAETPVVTHRETIEHSTYRYDTTFEMVRRKISPPSCHLKVLHI